MKLLTLLSALLLAMIGTAWADTGTDRRTYNDYLLKCSGCHSMDGSGHPDFGIPDFRGQVGYFLRLPDGRAFLMQVSGLINSGLSDQRAAEVTNFLVRSFAGASLPADFRTYTAEEAKRYRQTRPADLAAKRNELYQELTAAGYPIK